MPLWFIMHLLLLVQPMGTVQQVIPKVYTHTIRCHLETPQVPFDEIKYIPALYSLRCGPNHLFIAQRPLRGTIPGRSSVPHDQVGRTIPTSS